MEIIGNRRKIYFVVRVRTNFQTTSWNQVEENSLKIARVKKNPNFSTENGKWGLMEIFYTYAELAFCVQEHVASP